MVILFSDVNDFFLPYYTSPRYSFATRHATVPAMPQYYKGQRMLPPDLQVKGEPDSQGNPGTVPLSQAAQQEQPSSSAGAGAAPLVRPKECINKYSTPAFTIVCSLMDRLRQDEPGKRRETLVRFLNMWRAKVGNDLYPLIRLLVPDVGSKFTVARIQELVEELTKPERPREASVQPQGSHARQVLY
jgi:hypothetical protein